MIYQLAPWNGESISVPQIVINQLCRGEENLTRVALYILATHSTDPTEIARELRLKSISAAQRALDFWYGAGLLDPVRTTTPEPEIPVRPPKLTAAEIAAISCTDPQISVLINEAQKLLGEMIGQGDMTILVSLYHNDKIPVDTLLYAIAHSVSEGHRSIRFIERVVLRWKKSGIITGQDAERYLHLLEQRQETEKQVAQVLNCSEKNFTVAEKKIIAVWFEEMHYDISMVQEAAMYAEGKKSIRYINGIFKSWYAKGWRTLKDVQAAKAVLGANIQPAVPTSPTLPTSDRMTQRKKPLKFLVEED